MKIASVLMVSFATVALAASAFAIDISATSKYLCRVEEGKSPSLVKVGSLKAAPFSVALKQLNNKIAAAKANVDRIAATRNRGKLAAAKARLAAAKAEKKKITDCRAGKLSGTSTGPTPTPVPNTDKNKVALTFEEKFGTYTINGQNRCAFFTFFKWPAISGAVFNKISYLRSVNNPPAIPSENEVAPPYEDAYIYRGISGNVDTGISFNVEPGFHWVQFGRFDSFGNDCTSADRRMEIMDYRAGSYSNGFAHRAN